jgi:AcrR family transcriptional regulator
MENMVAKPKPNKREAILSAMLDVVAERGFHEAPMSLISERSGASAGVIYHHFESKEAIIQALAERTAWDFIAREGRGLELSVVNPVAVFGPVLGPDYSASLRPKAWCASDC